MTVSDEGSAPEPYATIDLDLTHPSDAATGQFIYLAEKGTPYQSATYSLSQDSTGALKLTANFRVHDEACREISHGNYECLDAFGDAHLEFVKISGAPAPEESVAEPDSIADSAKISEPEPESEPEELAGEETQSEPEEAPGSDAETPEFVPPPVEPWVPPEPGELDGPAKILAVTLALGALALGGGLAWYFLAAGAPTVTGPGAPSETISKEQEEHAVPSTERPEPLTSPTTGESLAVDDNGRYRVDGNWLSEEEARHWIAEEKRRLVQEREAIDQKLERWHEEDRARRAQKLREEHMVYEQATDSWRPGEDHAETIARRRHEELERVRRFIQAKVEDPLRSQFLEDLADRVHDNGGNLERLHKAVLDQEWHARRMRDASAHLDAADWYEAAESTAKTTRDTAQLANRIIGSFVPGAGNVINTLQAGLTGSVAGYEEGGWSEALTAGGARAWDLVVERYTGIPGIGTAMRQAAGSGYTPGEAGQWTSPLDRFAEHWAKNITDQYDPREWAKSLEEARQRWREGQYVQAIRDAGNVVLDVKDAGADAQRFTRKTARIVERAREAGIRIDYGQGPSPRTGPTPPTTEAPGDAVSLKGQARRMAERVTRLDDGHYARLDDVLDVQRSTRATRSLKHADVPDHVREGFNNTLRKRVYEPHDAELLDYVRARVSGMQDKRLRVHDFRTPGAGSSAINTDRDYRVQYQDADGNWHEVKKEHWQEKSFDLFAKHSHYDADKARSLLGSEAERAAWDSMSDAQRKARWAEMHAQTPTDKFHIEASRDYSDQKLTDVGRRVTGESNIVRVKRGEAILEDPRGLADMYKVKTDLELQRGNNAEAIAQMKKTADTLAHVREGYVKQGFEVGEVPDSMRRAMELVKNVHVDQRADAAYLAEVESQLRDLGFRGLGDLNGKMCNQIEGLQFARQSEPSGPAFSTRIWRSAYRTDPPASLADLLPESAGTPPSS